MPLLLIKKILILDFLFQKIDVYQEKKLWVERFVSMKYPSNNFLYVRFLPISTREIMSVGKLVETTHNICKVWGSNPATTKKKKILPIEKYISYSHFLICQNMRSYLSWMFVS